jgi:hypothetical protein
MICEGYGITFTLPLHITIIYPSVSTWSRSPCTSPLHMYPPGHIDGLGGLHRPRAPPALHHCKSTGDNLTGDEDSIPPPARSPYITPLQFRRYNVHDYLWQYQRVRHVFVISGHPPDLQLSCYHMRCQLCWLIQIPTFFSTICVVHLFHKIT